MIAHCKKKKLENWQQHGRPRYISSMWIFRTQIAQSTIVEQLMMVIRQMVKALAASFQVQPGKN